MKPVQPTSRIESSSVHDQSDGKQIFYGVVPCHSQVLTRIGHYTSTFPGRSDLLRFRIPFPACSATSDTQACPKLAKCEPSPNRCVKISVFEKPLQVVLCPL